MRTLPQIILFLIFAFNHPVSAQDTDTDSAVKVELIDAGAEPRHIVRFSPQVGHKQTAEMIIEMQQKMSLGGAQMPSQEIPAQEIPAQKMTIVIEVTDVSPEGNISFKFEYTDMEVVADPNNPSPIAANMQKMLEPMIGATGRGVVSNRGFTQEGEFDVPDGLNAQLKQMLAGMKDAMNRLSSPVPAEAIGQGAKWRVTQNMVANGMKITQTSTHQIKTIDTNGFDMLVTISQNAKPQEIQNPMLPAGTKLKLDSLQSSGSGNATINQSSIFPLASQAKISVVAHMTINAAGQTQKMKTDMKMGVSLKQIGE